MIHVSAEYSRSKELTEIDKTCPVKGVCCRGHFCVDRRLSLQCGSVDPKLHHAQRSRMNGKGRHQFYCFLAEKPREPIFARARNFSGGARLAKSRLIGDYVATTLRTQRRITGSESPWLGVRNSKKIRRVSNEALHAN